MYMYLHVHVQITRLMYMGTPHAREVVKGKLLFVTEDQILIQNCLFTHRYKSLNGNTVYLALTQIGVLK